MSIISINELPVKRNVRISIIWIAAYDTTISRHVCYILITGVFICTVELPDVLDNPRCKDKMYGITLVKVLWMLYKRVTDL